ncbi:MAG: histidine--tRNA ligase [Coriobacteriia bacterium]|nr:histidine--tRNA ligase [Coriobacteriia bacterium]
MTTQFNASAPKGTADMLPPVARAWERLSRIAQDLFSRYGFEPIYTPIFEHTEVFTRGIGEATDIVSKEMYTFEDKGGRSITLRPEATAGVVRAALEHGLTANGQSAKVYCLGPMFRYERPQKGRMRQFWQIDAELLGAAEPTADAELITMMWRFIEACGIPAENMRLLINSMGDENCRPAYRDKVAAYIRANADGLCEECNRRADTNPLRAFDCKNPACKEIMGAAPMLRDELCVECREHYSAVKGLLDELGIPYVEDPSLVRGLDYYTRTVFEVQVDAGLGSQNAIGGGGRYDRLMQEYGGPPTPGLGFALGFERLLLAMEAAGALATDSAHTDVFVALAEPTARRQAYALVSAVRDAGVSAEMDHRGKSLKSQMKMADRLGASFVLILGADELQSAEVTMRDMNTKAETRVPLAGAPQSVLAALGR